MDYVVKSKTELPIASRSCGDCQKCCEGHLEAEIYGGAIKPGTPCRFLEKEKGGCSIYSKRPKNPCQTYQCLWLKDEKTPDWIKPNRTNAIIDDLPINGFPCIRVNEAGEKLPSDVLTYAMEYAISRDLNLFWKIEGVAHWMGSPEFCASMEQLHGKQSVK